MARRGFILAIAVACLSACAIGPRTSNAIPLTDASGIRDLGDGPFLLEFLAIKAGTEDRVVLEFDISERGRHFNKVILKFKVENLDEEGERGLIDVYAFSGDGVIEANDFYAGERVTRVSPTKRGKVRADVTGAVNAALAAGEQLIGFRLSTEDGDRYFLGQIAGLQEPRLQVRSSKSD
jgi:hypothetical protein